MDGQESTFLEDFVQAIELLPNDLRRNFELIRELDRDSGELAKECLQIGVWIVLFSLYLLKLFIVFIRFVLCSSRPTLSRYL